MATEILVKNHLKGGAFIIHNEDQISTFSPENFSEEQRMIKKTVEDFIQTEVHPNIYKIEKQDDNIAASILEKLGELGLLGTHMPEEYGGMHMDFNTNTVIGEAIGPSGSISVVYNAHTGIGMLPILYFGTEEQKEKYLPKLVSGAYKASYCLTEPSSGSDALAAKTTAMLSKDGSHYIVNGQKMWITNAGFADIFTVFVQIDGDKFTALILERDMEGLTFGEEEHKLGIKGSSTRMVFMEDVKVPVENVLGEIGKGHKIAFNVLNTGRFKLGVSVVGGSKEVMNETVKYAVERKQFGQSISKFGAIQYKIAEMGIRNFIAESVLYRTSHLIQEDIMDLSPTIGYAEAKLKSAEEYAIECSIVKILGSEVLDYVVDEAVQIHGGMGYSEEGVIARAYRDSRINRIFEGTNEINRLLIVNTIFKKVMAGKLDIVTPALAVQSELQSNSDSQYAFTGMYAAEKGCLANFKKVLLMVLGSAAKSAMEGTLDLKVEQELLTNIADIIIDLFALESMVARLDSMELEGTHVTNPAVYQAMTKVAFYDSSHAIYKNALDAISGFVAESDHDKFIHGFRKYTKYPIQNVKELRRTIADAFITERGWCF